MHDTLHTKYAYALLNTHSYTHIKKNTHTRVYAPVLKCDVNMHTVQYIYYMKTLKHNYSAKYNRTECLCIFFIKDDSGLLCIHNRTDNTYIHTHKKKNNIYALIFFNYTV